MPSHEGGHQNGQQKVIKHYYVMAQYDVMIKAALCEPTARKDVDIDRFTQYIDRDTYIQQSVQIGSCIFRRGQNVSSKIERTTKK